MIKKRHTHFIIVVLIGFLMASCHQAKSPRTILSFNEDWSFSLADSTLDASNPSYDDADWRVLDVPHDWSIEGEFSEDHPATAGGGALPGGIGWYRKSFQLDVSQKGKQVYVQFDGIYMDSEVWINGTYLGKRPFGYISFEYDLTPYLNFGSKENVLAVKVNNANQPNSRWYSGSGIYRNTRLVITDAIHVTQWGTYVTTPEVTSESATVSLETTVLNPGTQPADAEVYTLIKNQKNQVVANTMSSTKLVAGKNTVAHSVTIKSPELWSIDSPHLYTVVTEIRTGGELTDHYETPMGVRTFTFDQKKGFILNGESVKIKGVCMHHDLGSLGSAINTRALERQLEILRGMGVNAIRTSHNPPAPELLGLCDQMGFLVMDESFDMWSLKKSPYDYAQYWDEWHKRDLEDFIQRDRNHPSIIMWSTGNEILEQWGDQGPIIAKELYDIVKALDATRPITVGMNPPVNMTNAGVTTQFEVNYNSISKSDGIDVIGYNYAHQTYPHHQANFPDKPFIATETTSGLMTRGYYDTQSDTVKRWPIRWDIPFDQGNPGNTVSAYDQVSAPWGSTHEETWQVIKNDPSLSGMFIWTGFDYIGEPTPYTWPSRSSYFGVIDLAGFPKDVYYMYQSEWTDQDVLHVYPHWNWTGRDSVDVWAYYNHADEVELFLDGKSLGTKSKEGEDLHVMWRVAYAPGQLKAVSRKGGQEVLTQVIETTNEASQIALTADRQTITADGKDLSFITVEVQDDQGRTVPVATDLIQFAVAGQGKIVGVDNGDPTSHLSMKGNKMRAMAGKCLVIVQSGKSAGQITLTASGEGLTTSSLVIETK
ncbi:beta-galactosidase [Reichenbachiella agariperforans]|uniref:Beta-galactosidase n=2 Tax=Reichenbachiella agariperforans TaxID=156994 RepID=A0A1M6UXK1_REIAG|nr:beta-galactosidase [Reichenbachiella agariperforans]